MNGCGFERRIVASEYFTGQSVKNCRCKRGRRLSFQPTAGRETKLILAAVRSASEPQQSHNEDTSRANDATLTASDAPPAHVKHKVDVKQEAGWGPFGWNFVLDKFSPATLPPAQIDSPSTRAQSEKAASTSKQKETGGVRQSVLIIPNTNAEQGASTAQSKGGFIVMFRRSKREKLEVQPYLPAVSNHEAVRLIRQRAQNGSKPGQRTDNFKLGLVVEGGGMRGAVTGGALMALLNLGFRDCFDVVYGSSAGAINATYFLSGQTEGVDIYAEDIANKDFCDLYRLMRKGTQEPVLNLSFLLEYVMEHVKPLCWDSVLQSAVPLKVVASSLDRLQSVVLDEFQDKHDLLHCLKASANIPEIVGGPITHRGERLVDAAVFEPVPFRAAMADGCTHVLALCSRPPSRTGIHGALEDALSAAIKHMVLSPEYMKDAWKREIELISSEGISQEQMLKLGLQPGAHQLPFFNGAHVCPVYPGNAARFAPVCTDPPTLRAGVSEGWDTVMKVFTPLVLDHK